MGVINSLKNQQFATIIIVLNCDCKITKNQPFIMPVIKTLTNRNNTRVFIWKVDESEAWLRAGLELSQNSLQRLSTMSSELHRRGFLSIRHLLRAAGYTDQNLFYNNLGKPHLDDGKFISITHSFELTAIIISDVKIGIDIEKRRDKIERIAPKFINYEKDYVDSSDHKVSLLTVVWGAKESMYKCLGMPGLGFHDHCKVEPFKMEDGQTLSRIDFNDIQRTFDTYFEEILEYSMVYILPAS